MAISENGAEIIYQDPRVQKSFSDLLDYLVEKYGDRISKNTKVSTQETKQLSRQVQKSVR